MVIVYDTAVRANGYVNAGFLEISVTLCANVDKCSCLSSADTFCFTGDTNRTPANANLNKVCTAVCQKSKARSVNDVTCAYLNLVAVFFSYPSNSALLPL